MPGITIFSTPEDANPLAVKLFCGGVKAVALLARPFLKAMNAMNSARFPSPRSSPSYPFVDDGRYDYGLSQPEHGILLEKDVRIPMRDGTELHGDAFRPDAPGRFRVIMAEAPYPRYIPVQPGVEDNGGVGTRYQQFEQANPEYWVPRGYVYVTINTRGYGGSDRPSAFLDYQEAVDYYDAIEWAASQPWSNGKVGLFGISYYAMSQYFAAALRPPHLAAIVPWEGLMEPYRDIAYRGGILGRFVVMFSFMMQVTADRSLRSKNFMRLLLTHPYLDDLWTYGTGLLDGRTDTPRIPDDVKLIEVPMLSVGNLNDPDLHLRGNVNAFTGASSREKKLLLYSWTHWGSAYQPWARMTGGLGLWDSQLVRGERSCNSETWWFKPPWAGTFRYRDMVCGFEGTVAVSPRVPDRVEPGRKVKVILGLEPPLEGTGFDVQLRSGGGEWETAREGVAEKEVELDPLTAGRYEVRCRLRSLGVGEEARTEWSPPAAFQME